MCRGANLQPKPVLPDASVAHGERPITAVPVSPDHRRNRWLTAAVKAAPADASLRAGLVVARIEWSDLDHGVLCHLASMP